MKHSKQLLFKALLFVFISLVFNIILPFHTVDIQLHDTYLVLTKSSFFFPFIFFFLLFSGFHFLLEKQSIKESEFGRYHYWDSLFTSFLVIAILY